MTTDDEHRYWALNDRHAKIIIIGVMLTLQMLFLLSTMLWQ